VRDRKHDGLKVLRCLADIKGSMELMEDIDPEKAWALVDPALKLKIGIAGRNTGSRLLKRESQGSERLAV